MKRNRSVRTLPLENLSLFKHPLPELPHEKHVFGEEISKENSPIFEKNRALSSDDSLDTILTGLRDLSTDNSSSSLSWGDEYKSEASKQVRDELEHMDRVLRGLEPIPPNYDEEEYREWMEFFPNLCVLGRRFGTYSNQFDLSEHPEPEEILAIHPEDNCDNVKSHDEIKTKIKKAVINQIYEKIANNAPKITLNLNDNIDIDNYLKISPIGGGSGNELLTRRRSSRTLISSQISSSKWLKEDGEYNSLPFLMRSERNGAPKSILKNSLVLPPIEMSQFRSISATPRRESKSLSALSVKERMETKYFVVKKSGFKRKEL